MKQSIVQTTSKVGHGEKISWLNLKTSEKILLKKGLTKTSNHPNLSDVHAGHYEGEENKDRGPACTNYQAKKEDSPGSRCKT